MTGEDIVCLRMFIEDCNLQEFQDLISNISFQVKSDTEIIREFELAKNNFDNWIQTYPKKYWNELIKKLP